MRSVLVTGSNRGLGLAIVGRMLTSKSPPGHVFATCRRPEQATELQNLASCHSNLHILPFDVTDFESYGNLVDRVSDAVKDDGLNVLFNNAGIPGKYSRISYFKASHLIETFTVNTAAPIMLTKAFVPLLKQASRSNKHLPMGTSRAAVVNMSSILGSIGLNKDGGHYLYRCSKSALNAATKSFSVDLKSSGILVVSLHPGWVKTDMGGPNAPMTTDRASQHIAQLLCSLSEEHNGGFYSYDGSPLQW
ncbi:hypothetical protein AAG570_000381 [Ranatra chinensis]|uniref:C-factor n=1 Tax=Ranatra chinensis TaxID=642074 RepID=A0ABD0YZ18_9HEMI